MIKVKNIVQDKIDFLNENMIEEGIFKSFDYLKRSENETYLFKFVEEETIVLKLSETASIVYGKGIKAQMLRVLCEEVFQDGNK